jgi:hypothetical protein
MLVADGVLRLFIGASFGLDEEFRKLMWCGQFGGSQMVGADTSKFLPRIGILRFLTRCRG